MANVNKVMLIGNLTRDPELRFIPSGAAVCEFGLAINRKWKGKDGQTNEEVCFVDLQAWARSAEVITEYCHKGDPLYIEGRLKLDTWDGRDGKKQSKLRVVVENFQLLGGRKSGAPQSAKQRIGEGVAEKVRENFGDDASPRDDNIPF